MSAKQAKRLRQAMRGYPLQSTTKEAGRINNRKRIKRLLSPTVNIGMAIGIHRDWLEKVNK